MPGKFSRKVGTNLRASDSDVGARDGNARCTNVNRHRPPRTPRAFLAKTSSDNFMPRIQRDPTIRLFPREISSYRYRLELP
jgi:hypothetical protein